ncbi:MAG: two-component regulator propeller domain-containing protein [Bacteroidota bacterium]
MDNRVLSRCAVIKYGLAVLALVIVLLSSASSQTALFSEDARWKQFTTESGLPSNDIEEVAETADSTLWVVAGSHLLWFDGFEWISTDSQLGIHGDYRAGIFCVTGDSLIVFAISPTKPADYYIGSKEGFHLIQSPGVCSGVVKFGPDRYLVRADTSLYLSRKNSPGTFEPFQEFVGTTVSDLLQTKNGHVFVSASSGFYRWSERKWTKLIPAGVFPVNMTTGGLAENDNGTGIAQFTVPYEKEGIWDWTSSGKPRHNTSERVDQSIALDIGPHDEAIIVYRSGDVRWREHGVWTSVPELESRARDITSVKFRSNGDLLIGTRNGLMIVKRSSSNWRFLTHTPPDPRNSVNELLKARDGSLWIGSSGGIEHRAADGSYAFINEIGSQVVYAITALGEDSTGSIWAGSGSAFTGAYRLDRNGWSHISIADTGEQVYIHKIRKDRNGDLWFLGLRKSTTDSNGSAFRLEGDRFIRWGVDMAGGRVYDFLENPDGSYWFATFSGVSRWSPRNKLLSSLRGRKPEENPDGGSWTHWDKVQGIDIGRVTSLALDNENNVWFGSNFSQAPWVYGIGRIDRNDSLHLFGPGGGFPDGAIWDLKSDSAGRIWIATINGLNCYDHGMWLTYDERSGLSFPNLWPVLPLGSTIYVGTKGKGVGIMDLEKMASFPPRILIERPFIDERSARLAWKTLTYYSEVEPPEVMTRFCIDGAAWSDWSKQHTVVLEGLNAGEHRLQVQAKNLYGWFERTGTTASFTVTPAWYKRTGAVIAFGFIGSTLVWLAALLLIRKRRYDLALRSSEARFRAVATTTASAIFVWREKQFLYINPSAVELTGYPLAELYRKTLEEIVHTESLESVRQLTGKWMNQMEGAKRFECRIITKNGDQKWIDVTAGRTTFQGGAATIASAFDCTEKKKAMEDLAASERRLRSMASELIETQTRERKRLAAYLHDSIGQALSVARMKVDAVTHAVSIVRAKSDRIDGSLDMPEEALVHLDSLSNLIRTSINETRALTFELSPPILFDLGLVPALDWLIGEMERQHGLAGRLRNSAGKFLLADAARDTLFEGTREILMNVIKHARAQHVDVDVALDNSSVTITVRDDGIGFDLVAMKQQLLEKKSFGLDHLTRRLNDLGGKIEIVSECGKGTCVRLVAPIIRSQNLAEGNSE